MLALSIQQPWAWLIVNGHKDIENRTWSASKRGPIWIHAGLKVDVSAIEHIRWNYPDIELPALIDLPTGGVVGMATIVDCVERHPSRWFVGPYGFVLKDQQPLDLRPFKGKLGFFEVP
jgi:hypothetical protein